MVYFRHQKWQKIDILGGGGVRETHRAKPGQVENSEIPEITEASESDFPMFLFPSFRLRHRVY